MDRSWKKPAGPSLGSIESLVQDAQSAGDDDAAQSIWLAEKLLERARQLLTPQERRQQAELDRMIGHPDDKATLVEMTDQAFRTSTPARVADQLTHILDLQGVPRFFNPLEQTMLRGFQSFGEYLPGVAVPLVKEKMRQETANVILPAEPEMLTTHLSQRQREGVRMNVNLLGEALLGEEEAKRRLREYLFALQLPEVECISVKISTIYSQISPIARSHSTRIISDRLELLYRAAARETFRRSDGSETSKFVYLDMEEYRDLHMTVDAMKQALEREGMETVRAGVALQAYIPDSYAALCDLIEWAAQRVEQGGAPLTVRLVKGANMEMERVEAAIGGWQQAPFASKLDTDANFKRMLLASLGESSRGAIKVGVASHNLFDVALAMLWAHRLGRLADVQFEMLEGMANHQRRALFEASRSMLLYAPACRREEFTSAIGYLVRRLDENTGQQNFLRHSFRLHAGSDEWHQLADAFRQSLQHADRVSTASRKLQNRFTPAQMPTAAPHWSQFRGDPDTDWSLPIHAEWAEQIVDQWTVKADGSAMEVPLEIGGQPRAGTLRESYDPSRPGTVVCRYHEAGTSEVDDAIACAANDPSGWRQRSVEERHDILRDAAQWMRQRRGDLIGAAMADAGKVISEADAEVSEAIDFTEFYPLTVRAMLERSSIKFRPRGAVVVVSPWNFPLAIPCGGVVSSLAAGNTVILKPASDTVLPAYLIAQCLWDAGVPKQALQLVPCAGSRGGQQLTQDPRVDAVILTGGTETARQILRQRPDLHLLAETGGKNATIVTALADRELAIKHVLHSAFGHGGQKCSATSLLLLEDEVYEDHGFRETLADAVRSLRVGSVWDLSNRIGPLIRPPRGELARGMKELEPGESWLVMPEPVDDNRQLFRPGVKWNVRPGSFTHRTELFGPVLGVIRYRRLDEAIGIVNATGYGLTSGLESLDDREQDLWRQTIRAGNLYINRPTTGAIVLRQPFGGVGNSAYGPGVKAGGPHYVLPLMHLQPVDQPPAANDIELDDRLQTFANIVDQLHSDELLTSTDSAQAHGFLNSAQAAWNDEFSKSHDNMQILGQDNLRRYRGVRQTRLRIGRGDDLLSVLVAITSAVAVRGGITVSYSAAEDDESLQVVLAAVARVADHLARFCEVIEETDEQLAAAVETGEVDRLRYLSHSRRKRLVDEVCGAAFVSVIDEPVVLDGYVELLRYLNEQSVSHDYHRYGNLGRRSDRSGESETNGKSTSPDAKPL